VNDVYKQYFRPLAPEREYVRASYVASLGVVVVGSVAGLFIQSVSGAVDWIVNGLWGGYAGANILKWYWWRLNGFGYFWGMIVGIASALALLYFPEDMQALEAFPLILLLSVVGCIAGSLLTTDLTTAQDKEELIEFYMRTRPWGWWGPIREAAKERDPSFQPNPNFRWDFFNVVVGIVWQTAFVALPIYMVIHHWREAGICLAVIAVTSTILKRTWYDRLENE
jgi:Na+/proline symporter